MSNVKPRDLTRNEKLGEFEGNIRDLPRPPSSAFRRPDDDTGEPAGLIRRSALESTGEIDRLIDNLQKLRGKLEDDGNRVQRDIVEYVSLSQSVVQMTKIVSDSMVYVKKPSVEPSSDMGARNSVILTAIGRELNIASSD
jgi:hypothetical protein